MNTTTKSLTKREGRLKTWIRSILGLPMSVKTPAKRKKGRTVIQYNSKGKKVAEFPSVQIASEYSGIDYTTIWSTAAGRGHNKTAGGYIWKFKDETGGKK